VWDFILLASSFTILSALTVASNFMLPVGRSNQTLLLSFASVASPRRFLQIFLLSSPSWLWVPSVLLSSLARSDLNCRFLVLLLSAHSDLNCPFHLVLPFFGLLWLELPFHLVRTNVAVGTGYHELLLNAQRLFFFLRPALHSNCPFFLFLSSFFGPLFTRTALSSSFVPLLAVQATSNFLVHAQCF
jgi:hypothetical protein